MQSSITIDSFLVCFAGSYFATEATYSHMYTDSAAASNRSRIQQSLFGLGMRAIPLSYRRHVATAAPTLGSLYPIGSAPPAHQSKSAISSALNVQPAHQPILPPSHITPGNLADVLAFGPPIFRIPSAASQPSLGAGRLWTGNSSPVVDPNHVGSVVSNRPTSFSASCPHSSLFLPPPTDHRLLPSVNPGMVPSTSGSQPPVSTPQFPSSTHTHHSMFFARVLVGRSAVGRSDYRTPPPLNPSEPFGHCFDSCVNRPLNPTIYVVFNSAQSYPEYLIEYANKAKTADPM